MDCAVIYSEAALADLEQITAFIAVDKVEAARRFANRLIDMAESLRPMQFGAMKVARCLLSATGHAVFSRRICHEYAVPTPDHAAVHPAAPRVIVFFDNGGQVKSLGCCWPRS